jgi:hypothetical protein
MGQSFGETTEWDRTIRNGLKEILMLLDAGADAVEKTIR